MPFMGLLTLPLTRMFDAASKAANRARTLAISGRAI